MQWSKKARELMRNQCTGKIWRNDTPLGGDIQNQEKEIFTSLGKIYTGETRRKRETLEKKDKGDGEKRNTRYYGVGRFLPPFQKSPLLENKPPFLNILSRLFPSLFPFLKSTYFPKPYFSLFSPILSCFEFGLCFKNQCHVSFYKPWSFFGNMHVFFLRKSKRGGIDE